MRTIHVITLEIRIIYIVLYQHIHYIECSVLERDICYENNAKSRRRNKNPFINIISIKLSCQIH